MRADALIALSPSAVAELHFGAFAGGGHHHTSSYRQLHGE